MSLSCRLLSVYKKKKIEQTGVKKLGNPFNTNEDVRTFPQCFNGLKCSWKELSGSTQERRLNIKEERLWCIDDIMKRIKKKPFIFSVAFFKKKKKEASLHC